MSQPPESPAAPSADLQIPMPTVVRFVRQLSHDLRNHLNAAELQSAYLKEIAEDAEIKDEIQRLRGMLSEMGSSLQKLTSALAPPRLNEMHYGASDLLEDLRTKVGMDFAADAAAFDWEISSVAGALNIDPQLLQQAFLELFRNALRHGRGEGTICVSAAAKGAELVLTLAEPKTGCDVATEQWGLEPFKSVKHGHYALGLHRARSIVEAHGGRLSAKCSGDGSSLVTTVALPLAEAP